MTGKSTRELLSIGEEENTLRGPGTEYWGEAGETETANWTLFKDPATAEDIVNLEERLGITLANDYKDFLQVSN